MEKLRSSCRLSRSSQKQQQLDDWALIILGPKTPETLENIELAFPVLAYYSWACIRLNCISCKWGHCLRNRRVSLQRVIVLEKRPRLLHAASVLVPGFSKIAALRNNLERPRSVLKSKGLLLRSTYGYPSNTCQFLTFVKPLVTYLAG